MGELFDRVGVMKKIRDECDAEGKREELRQFPVAEINSKSAYQGNGPVNSPLFFRYDRDAEEREHVRHADVVFRQTEKSRRENPRMVFDPEGTVMPSP